MIPQLQITNLVDEESLKGGVEERGRLEPLKVGGQLVAVDEEPSEEKAAYEEGGNVSSIREP